MRICDEEKRCSRLGTFAGVRTTTRHRRQTIEDKGLVYAQGGDLTPGSTFELLERTQFKLQIPVKITKKTFFLLLAGECT